jgi:CRISPR/Cas system-associated endoribonuclease Cas2
MPFYVIAYDLRDPDRDYEDLYSELAAADASRVQGSVWVVCTPKTAGKLSDALWAHMHNEKDRLLVSEMSGGWISRNGMVKIKPLKDECQK